MWSVFLAAIPVFVTGAVFMRSALRSDSKKSAFRAAKILFAAAIAGAIILALSTAVFYSSAAKEADKALATAARADFALFLKIDLGAVAGFTVLMLISLTASPGLAPVRGIAGVLWSLLSLLFTYAASLVSSGTFITSVCIMTSGAGAAILPSLGGAAELCLLGRRLTRDDAFREKRASANRERANKREKKRAALQKRRSLKNASKK